jgi:hypothetical protein
MLRLLQEVMGRDDLSIPYGSVWLAKKQRLFPSIAQSQVDWRNCHV